MIKEVEHAYFRSLGFGISMQHNGVRDVGKPARACISIAPANSRSRFISRGIELFRRAQFSVVRVGDKSLSLKVALIRGSTQVSRGQIDSVAAVSLENGKMKSVLNSRQAAPQLTASNLTLSAPGYGQ